MKIQPNFQPNANSRTYHGAPRSPQLFEVILADLAQAKSAGRFRALGFAELGMFGNSNATSAASPGISSSGTPADATGMAVVKNAGVSQEAIHTLDLAQGSRTAVASSSVAMTGSKNDSLNQTWADISPEFIRESHTDNQISEVFTPTICEAAELNTEFSNPLDSPVPSSAPRLPTQHYNIAGKARATLAVQVWVEDALAHVSMRIPFHNIEEREKLVKTVETILGEFQVQLSAFSLNGRKSEFIHSNWKEIINGDQRNQFSVIDGAASVWPGLSITVENHPDAINLSGSA